ncbi:MAG: hypothetical protein GX289_04280 [Tissierellia bacterium]|nr:hypothetical protein [Tissierellia bacterium]
MHKFILMQNLSEKSKVSTFNRLMSQISQEKMKVGGNMKIKEIYPILILTLVMSLIITYGISEGKVIYAFTRIFAEESAIVEAEDEETKRIRAKITKAKLTLKESQHHIESDRAENEIRLAYNKDQYIDYKEAVQDQEAASRSGFRFSKALDMAATAYDLSYESCGKYPDHPEYGITASGTKAQPGTVAVDPDVIPLGTKLYIASTDGSPDYGFATALDTGSAIKGYKIDLFMENNQDALNFGIRQVKVYILD